MIFYASIQAYWGGFLLVSGLAPDGLQRSFRNERRWINLSTKLYVGNLNYDVTGDQLTEHFAQAGTVTDAVVITDKYSGRSKGFGFVEMSKDEEAKKAIEMFKGKDF